jgi:hypothetical protein
MPGAGASYPPRGCTRACDNRRPAAGTVQADAPGAQNRTNDRQ